MTAALCQYYTSQFSGSNKLQQSAGKQVQAQAHHQHRGKRRFSRGEKRVWFNSLNLDLDGARASGKKYCGEIIKETEKTMAEFDKKMQGKILRDLMQRSKLMRDEAVMFSHNATSASTSTTDEGSGIRKAEATKDHTDRDRDEKGQQQQFNDYEIDLITLTRRKKVANPEKDNRASRKEGIESTDPKAESQGLQGSPSESKAATEAPTAPAPAPVPTSKPNTPITNGGREPLVGKYRDSASEVEKLVGSLEEPSSKLANSKSSSTSTSSTSPNQPHVLHNPTHLPNPKLTSTSTTSSHGKTHKDVKEDSDIENLSQASIRARFGVGEVPEVPKSVKPVESVMPVEPAKPIESSKADRTIEFETQGGADTTAQRQETQSESQSKIQTEPSWPPAYKSVKELRRDMKAARLAEKEERTQENDRRSSRFRDYDSSSEPRFGFNQFQKRTRHLAREYIILTPSQKIIKTSQIPLKPEDVVLENSFHVISQLDRPHIYRKSISKLEKQGWKIIGGGGKGDLIVFERVYNPWRRTRRRRVRIVLLTVGGVGTLVVGALAFTEVPSTELKY